MRRTVLLVVPLILAGCASPPVDPVDTASIALDPRTPTEEVDERGGDWALQAGAEGRPLSVFGSRGWSIVMIPRNATNVTFEVTWTHAASTTGLVLRLADGDGAVVFEAPLEASPALVTLDESDEDARGERIVFVEGGAPGVTVGLEYAFTLRYLRSA